MTYSIVARDPDTGQMGVAVQSHYFTAGRVVAWTRPGVGAVATQAMAEIAHGPRGLDGLAAGRSPEEVLSSLLDADPGRATRQVAMVDARGRVAAHTGHETIAEAGHRTGEGFSVQANMMWRASVWDAMADAYLSAGGDLTARLLASLRAAQDEGGDVRGQQSAGLVVVAAEGAPWDRLVDVRVDDHPSPLDELERLADLARAYGSGEHSAALGTNPELLFWTAVRHAAEGRVDQAADLLGQFLRPGDGWSELLRRLPATGRLPDDPDLIDRLTAAAR